MGGFKFENININTKNKETCRSQDCLKENPLSISKTHRSEKEKDGDDGDDVTASLTNGKVHVDEAEELRDEEEQEDYHRGTWSRKMDFLLSVIGYSVGVSNLWRFPYLCLRNGGGAFLIPFFFFLIFCGIPLFFLELCLGQFSGVSSLFVWSLCPLFKGLGYLMVIVSFVMSWYYITVLSWILYYLVNSFYDPLPWAVCTNDWNSPFCIEDSGKKHALLHPAGNNSGLVNASFPGNASFSMVPKNLTVTYDLRNGSYGNKSLEDLINTAAKEFWQFNVLDISAGLTEAGQVQWHLVLGLLVAWIMVFFSLMKGVKSVGKVVYVTALLPYLLLTIFLIRGLMLPGAASGIRYYLTPDFSRLLDFQVWLEAAIQVFYSLGPAWGGLITMSSYNKFHNNCLRDALYGSLADALTSFYGGFVIFSVLGYMSYEAKLPIEKVATSGPGLAMVAYPEAITKLPLPQIWAVLFFLMLLALGIDSQFGTFETVSSGLVDAFPKRLGNKKILVTGALSALLFVCGIPFTLNMGMYIFQLVDWYFASLCVMLTCFLECLIVGWLYGADKFSKDVELMLGRPVPLFIRWCWCIITPLVMLIVLIITMVNYQPPTYEGYVYPSYVRFLGLGLSLIPIIPLPVCMIWQISLTNGSILQRMGQLIKPTNDWGPHIRQYKKGYKPKDYSRYTYWELVLANLIGRQANH